MNKTGSTLIYLECPLTGEKFEPDYPHRINPSNGKPLLAKYDYKIASKTLTKSNLSKRNPDLWRYREVLPIRDFSNIFSLGEGFTPLIKSNRLSSHLGLKNLWIKDESLNPTGSFKARGLAVAISRAYELGIRNITMPSAGNAAGAMAAYAAKAGMNANVFMPKDVPLANYMECKYYGANVELIDGFINDCGRISSELAEKNDLFDISTMKEPYRFEGKKTMAYEIVEQLGWSVPDVIIYPTGGGTGVVGIWKAMNEMQELGLIGSERPKIISVQAEGCSPIFNAFIKGKRFSEEFSNPNTLASGMRVPSAIGDFLVLDAVRESGGKVMVVSDKSMIKSVELLSQFEGIFSAPEGGATLSALQKLIITGEISNDMNIVLMNTGTSLKYIEAVNAKN